MKKSIIWGTGDFGRKLFLDIYQKEEVTAFISSSSNKSDFCIIDCKVKEENQEVQIPIYSPDSLKTIDFDMVYVATRTGYTMVVHHLIELGISEEKINTEYCFSNNHARTSFLEMFAQYAEKHNLPGIIAEIGVFQGEFSVIINEAFPLRELHLFDTFEGFDERDIKYEYANGLTKQRIHTFKDTSIDLVRKRLPNAHNVVFHKGYFPETFDLYKEQFLFVSLDVDLYLPTKSGLELFYPLLVKNGVMLIDDYFSGTYPAIRKVVDEFCTEHNISALPIGDRYGIAIVK